MASSKTSLLQAIAAAEKAANGTASSATMRLESEPPAIEVIVHSGGAGHRVLINAATGAVMSMADIHRFPGEPTRGDAVHAPSGVMYYTIKDGDGDQVQEHGHVFQAHLTAWLVDGAMVHTTRPGRPMNLLFGPKTTVLAGLPDGMKGMKVGGKRKIILPPSLAYGEKGMPPRIPANASLIIDLELIAIDPYEKIPAELPGEPTKGDPVTLPSGVIYYDIQPGAGEQPADRSAIVKVLHTCYLTDGSEVESSAKLGQAAQFPLSAVINGWAEGMSTMKVGGKRKIIVPYKLGFGETGTQGVPPKATLIFDVELLDIVKPPDPPATAPGGGT